MDAVLDESLILWREAWKRRSGGTGPGTEDEDEGSGRYRTKEVWAGCAGVMEMKKYDMLKDAPGRSLFFFALPMILGNLFQQFYNMADSVIVGKCVGEDALAAVGASYSLTTVFIMIAIGGGIGASVITSQY